MTSHQTPPASSATPTNPLGATRHSAPPCSATLRPVSCRPASSAPSHEHRAANTLCRPFLPAVAALLLCLAPFEANAQQTAPTAKVATAAASSTWTDADTADLLVASHGDDETAVYGYKGTKKDIVIPNKIKGKPVVQISDDSFKDKGLTSVVLPDALRYIGFSAFAGNQIRELIIPGSVITIGANAFMSNKITNLIIPSSVREIGDDAFRANELTSLTLEVGKENRKIYGGAFRSNKLTSLTISSVSEFTTRFSTGVEEYTFRDNPITRVVLAHDASMSETSIDGEDFWKLYRAQALKTEKAGTYIKKDGVWTHQRESYVEGDFVIDMHRETRTGGVVVEYKGTKKDIVIPDKTNGWDVTAIADGVFRKKGLTSVVLPKKLERIGKEAFAFNNLTTLTMPGEVEFIGEEAFASNALTTLTFPRNGVFATRISEGAFSSNKLTAAIITLRHGKVAKRAFEGNPVTTIFLIPWDLSLEDDAFEKSFHEFLKGSSSRTGIFEKKSDTWTRIGPDETGKYWKEER